MASLDDEFGCVEAAVGELFCHRKKKKSSTSPTHGKQRLEFDLKRKPSTTIRHTSLCNFFELWVCAIVRFIKKRMLYIPMVFFLPFRPHNPQATRPKTAHYQHPRGAQEKFARAREPSRQQGTKRSITPRRPRPERPRPQALHALHVLLLLLCHGACHPERCCRGLAHQHETSTPPSSVLPCYRRLCQHDHHHHHPHDKTAPSPSTSRHQPRGAHGGYREII